MRSMPMARLAFYASLALIVWMLGHDTFVHAWRDSGLDNRVFYALILPLACIAGLVLLKD